MSEPEYHRATTDDAEAVASIINIVVEEPNPVGFDGPTTTENVQTWLTRQGDAGCIFLCLLDGKTVGFRAPDLDTTTPDTSVSGVWRLPEHRRKGLGTNLAEHALAFAREKGYKRIRGNLPDHNETALSFLSGIGALVPMYNPDVVFELPVHEGHD